MPDYLIILLLAFARALYITLFEGTVIWGAFKITEVFQVKYWITLLIVFIPNLITSYCKIARIYKEYQEFED